MKIENKYRTLQEDIKSNKLNDDSFKLAFLY